MRASSSAIRVALGSRPKRRGSYLWPPGASIELQAVKVEFAFDAGDTEGFPMDGLPEVAVLGRSNVGKSSFINALVGRRGLARTSAQPGKTRRIHFYRIEDRAYLVDLPGYGYAAVSQAERRAWRPMIEAYLRGARSALRGALLLVDVRRGPAEEEFALLEWLAAERIAPRIVLTKCDKLRSGELQRRVADHRAALPLAADAIACSSAHTGRGLLPVAAWLAQWTGIEPRRADGQPHLP
jgi:GTP-binding protein